jgi:hypothetical protein
MSARSGLAFTEYRWMGGGFRMGVSSVRTMGSVVAGRIPCVVCGGGGAEWCEMGMGPNLGWPELQQGWGCWCLGARVSVLCVCGEHTGVHVAVEVSRGVRGDGVIGWEWK